MNCPTLSELPLPPTGKTGWPWTEESLQFPAKMSDGHSWPRISIVTPSYNQGQFIEETIRSVIMQGYPNLEYIVIDGGSSDRSLEIIQKYSPWLSYWVSEQDRGQSHAINKGFVRASGDIFAWLNSDDLYASGALLKMAQKLSKKKRTIAVGTSIIFSTSATSPGLHDIRQPPWSEMLYHIRTFPQPSVFWTRDLWEFVDGLDENLYILMDYDLWLRFYPFVKETIFIKDVLSYSRSHQTQKSVIYDGSEEFVNQRVKVCLRAAQLRNESAYFWLIKVWYKRFRIATSKRKFYLLFGPGFHTLAFNEVKAIKKNVKLEFIRE